MNDLMDRNRLLAENQTLFIRTMDLDNRLYFWKCVCLFLSMALLIVLSTFGYYVWNGGHLS